MQTATYLLLILGVLGAADIALYHSISHGIRSHADSRHELVVHSLRGPTYFALFLLVPNVAMRGAWFWALIGLFVVDLGISIWDFLIEKKSRRQLGGLPSGEYVLHIVMAMVFGALVASVSFGAGHWAAEPTRLALEPVAVPALLRYALGAMALGVLFSGLQDALAAIRLG